MSRGGKHGYSVRIEKSYWISDTDKNNYETDNDRKRQGSKVEGPPKKKMRIENIGDMIETDHGRPSVTENRTPNATTPNSLLRIQSGERNGDDDNLKYINNVTYDDTESVATEFGRESIFMDDLFNDIDNVSSDTDASDDENTFYSDMLNIFGSFLSDDDEDRVIITEIFDDDAETDSPDKNKNCRIVSNKQ